MPRPRKSDDLHKLHGTYRTDRHGEGRGLKAPVEIPPCPKSLSKGARTEWHRVTKLLAASGHIAKLDMVLLACYCATWDEFIRLSDEMSKTPTLTEAIASGLMGRKN